MTASVTAPLPVFDLRPGAPNSAEDHAAWDRRCRRSTGLSGDAERFAAAALAAIGERGDQALIELTQQTEGRSLQVDELEVPIERARRALLELDPKLRAALELAAERVRRFHETQRRGDTSLEDGTSTLTTRVRALRRVAVYAPGGTAAYPSSVLMAAIPAAVAGVDEIILLTPRPSDVVLAAAAIAGVHRIFAVGGAQGICAAALGTATIPRVDKIVGPGNAYVTAAKRLVFGFVDIDGIAGPSEILIVADKTASPALIAADLLSQAEHDVEAGVVLVTDAPEIVGPVQEQLVAQLATLPREAIARRAVAEQGAIVLVQDRATMLEQAERYAPEHLELLIDEPMQAAAGLRHAGAIFVGPWTPEAAGDYTAGPSHVLPTAGAARFGSPLGVWDFVKHTSVLQLDRSALAEQATAITTLARAEGLEAHARAVEFRLENTARKAIAGDGP